MLNQMKRFVITSILLTSQAIASPNGGAVSTLRDNLASHGLGNIVSDGHAILAAGKQFSVTSIKTENDLAYITLQAAGDSATATVAVSTTFEGHSLVAVGDSVQASTTVAGQLLYVAGKLMAFIPNEMSNRLIYSRMI
jgi:hypothetical protein